MLGEQVLVEGGTKCSQSLEEIPYLGVLEKLSWHLAPKHKQNLSCLSTRSRRPTALPVPGGGGIGLEDTPFHMPAGRAPGLEVGQVTTGNWNFVKQITLFSNFHVPMNHLEILLKYGF